MGLGMQCKVETGSPQWRSGFSPPTCSDWPMQRQSNGGDSGASVTPISRVKRL